MTIQQIADRLVELSRAQKSTQAYIKGPPPLLTQPTTLALTRCPGCPTAICRG